MKLFHTCSIKKICLTIVFSLLIISCTTSTSESVDSSNNDSLGKTQKPEQSSSETAAKTSDPTPQPKASDPTSQSKASDPTPQPKEPDPTPQPKTSDPTPQPKASDPIPQSKASDPTPQPKASDPTPQPKASDPTPQPTATPEVQTNQIDPELMAKLNDAIKLGKITVEAANAIIADVILGKITVEAAEMKLMGLSDDQKNQGNQDHNVPNPCATVPKRDRARCEESFKSNPNVKPTPFPGTPTPTPTTITESFYVQNFDPNNIPKVAKFNFTELDKFSKMTKIRSGVGHDFSARTPEYDPTHLNCKSMKHYFMPVGVPRQMSLYRSTPHTFKWMDIKFFSPVDGVISDVFYTQTSYGTEAGFYIGSSEFPGYFFKFFHLSLDPNLSNGSIVKAGQQIGTLGGEETWGEIAVEVRLADGLNHLISFLQVASDDVLQQYKARGINSPSDVIITKAQRDANPLACDDSDAGWFIGSGTEGTPEDMQFIIWAFESSDNWFFFTETDQ